MLALSEVRFRLKCSEADKKERGAGSASTGTEFDLAGMTYTTWWHFRQERIFLNFV
jgi:hypothetical protein